jgi:cell wall assembly regulator SMI1
MSSGIIEPVGFGDSPQTVWAFIEAQLARVAPEVLADLRPGATEAQLDAAEAELDIRFPAFFRDFYTIHDGQKDQTVGLGLFFGLQLMSLEQIVREHRFWQELLSDDPDTYGSPGDSKSVPEDVIDTRYIHAGWIPFASDQCGNYFGLDFAPGPKGIAGQCISFGRDTYKKYLLGQSFEEFIIWIQTRFLVAYMLHPVPGFSSDSKSFRLKGHELLSITDLFGLLYFHERC